MQKKRTLVHTCSTNKHIVDLYQASKKGIRKIETNLIDKSDTADLTHLDVFEDRELSWPIDQASNKWSAYPSICLYLKFLKCFNMDNAHLLGSSMIVSFLIPNKNPLQPKEDDNEILGPKVSYLNAISVLLYLA